MRIRSHIEAAYEDSERQQFLNVSDLSESGAFLDAPDPPPIGREAKLILVLPDDPAILRLRGTVARCQLQQPAGFALHFDAQSLSDRVRAALRSYVLLNSEDQV